MSVGRLLVLVAACGAGLWLVWSTLSLVSAATWNDSYASGAAVMPILVLAAALVGALFAWLLRITRRR